jgi:hypothetical protein
LDAPVVHERAFCMNESSAATAGKNIFRHLQRQARVAPRLQPSQQPPRQTLLSPRLPPLHRTLNSTQRLALTQVTQTEYLAGPGPIILLQQRQASTTQRLNCPQQRLGSQALLSLRLPPVLSTQPARSWTRSTEIRIVPVERRQAPRLQPLQQQPHWAQIALLQPGDVGTNLAALEIIGQARQNFASAGVD